MATSPRFVTDYLANTKRVWRIARDFGYVYQHDFAADTKLTVKKLNELRDDDTTYRSQDWDKVMAFVRDRAASALALREELQRTFNNHRRGLQEQRDRIANR